MAKKLKQILRNTWIQYRLLCLYVLVAQLNRATGCGPVGGV